MGLIDAASLIDCDGERERGSCNWWWCVLAGGFPCLGIREDRAIATSIGYFSLFYSCVSLMRSASSCETGLLIEKGDGEECNAELNVSCLVSRLSSIPAGRGKGKPIPEPD